MDEKKPKTDFVCPLCGQTGFTLGRLRGSATVLRFQSDDSGFFEKLAMLDEEVRALRCNSCGHVLLIADSP